MQNFHTHTVFCDGKSTFEEFILTAIELKYKTIGFSSHAPTLLAPVWQMKQENFQKYLSELNFLKEKYKDQIQIKIGLEIDYIRTISKTENFTNANLDYSISSIHYIKGADNEFLTIDHSPEVFEKGIKKLFNNNVKEAVIKYYKTVREMISISDFNIIGHIDLIKKFNKNSKYFNEKENWYKKEVIKTVEEIAKTNKIVEINTRGFYKNLTEEFYPSNYFINLIKETKSKIIVNSDAHHYTELNLGINEAKKLLKKLNLEESNI